MYFSDYKVQNYIEWMDVRECNVTFAYVRPDRQTRTTEMRQITLMSRTRLPSNMTALGIEPESRG